MDDAVRFVLVLARVGGLFGFAPVFSSYMIPRQVKAALGLVLAFVLFPLAGVPWGGYPQDAVRIVLLIVNEVGIGLILGYIASLFLAAVQSAGQIIDMVMGFGIVNVVDPMANRQVTVVGQFELLLGMLIFLAIDGHHWLIEAVARSFSVFPAGEFIITRLFQADLRELFSTSMAMAFKIASPVVVAIFLADVILAFLARTVPQMNVFIVGFPLKIGAGFLMIILTLPLLVSAIGGIFSGMERQLLAILRG